MYLGKLLIKKPYFHFEERAVCSALNGVLLTVFNIYIGESAPVFMLLAAPTIIVIELLLMSRDDFFSYLYYWVKILCNFICIYWLLVSMIGLISSGHVTSDTIFPLTIFFSGWWCFFLSKNTVYPIRELKVMVHDRRKGFFHFAFLSVCLVTQIFSSLILRPILVDGLVDMGQVQKIFFVEMFLKTSLIFGAGYLLLFMKARELNEKENVRLLSLSLEKEEDFRKSTWKEAILSFYVNITGNQIQEGRDYFTPFMWENVNNYAEMLQKMVFYCIHPEDSAEFTAINMINNIEKNLEKGNNSAKQNVRMSPKEIPRMFKLPKGLRERYEKMTEEWVWLRVNYVYIRDSATQDICAYVSISDINEKMKKSEKLVEDATIDKLTGIYNRGTLERLIEARIAFAAEKKIQAGTFILVDVDYFKSVNDLLGHPAGDAALQKIAKAVKEIFRADDIVGRLGGDEFCIFIDHVTEGELLRKRLEEMNERCREDYPVEGKETIHLSISIGAVACTPEMKSYDDLYKYADLALYHTKQKGRDSYTLYSELKEGAAE